MVSIVIPVYNVEEYILDCLESIRKQSYLDYEVLVVNDGSTDNSLGVVKGFMEEHPEMNITLIDQKNQGVSVARNTGISVAKGDCICFVDSDDMLDSEYLRLLELELRNNDADVAVCKARNVPEDNKTFYRFEQSYSVQQKTNYEALEDLLYGNVKAGIWALLCKRSLLGTLRFAEGYKYSEDLELVWKLCAVANKCVFLDAPLYDYRIRAGSAMTKMNKARVDGMKLFLAMEEYIGEFAPDFLNTYKKYGVAKWVWSTVWQEALASKSNKEFCERIEMYDADRYMRRLFSFPKGRVKYLAILFCCSKRLYYRAIKAGKKGYRKIG